MLGAAHALNLLRNRLVPDGEKEIVDYCLRVGVRDSKVIADLIQKALVDRVAPTGYGIVVAYWTGSAGGGNRTALDFKAEIEGYTAGTLARVKIAVEEKLATEDLRARLQRWFNNHPVGVGLAVLLALASFVGVVVGAVVVIISLYRTLAPPRQPVGPDQLQQPSRPLQVPSPDVRLDVRDQR